MTEATGPVFDEAHWVIPQWPHPPSCPPLVAMTTTRGSAQIPLNSPGSPHWLHQVHGTRVINLDAWHPGIEADGAWTDRIGEIAVIQTADCLPILMTGQAHPFVAAIHAGWRGLAAGMVASAVEACPGHPDDMQVWLGPAISQAHYEVDAPVYQAFVGQNPTLDDYFQPTRSGHWRADLVGIAVWQFQRAGVSRIAVSGECTASAPGRYFSHRAGRTPADRQGRMSSLIWLA